MCKEFQFKNESNQRISSYLPVLIHTNGRNMYNVNENITEPVWKFKNFSAN